MKTFTLYRFLNKYFLKHIFLSALFFIPCAYCVEAGGDNYYFNLDLPPDPVPDRYTIVKGLNANTKETYVELDGPGCIKHIWLTLKHPHKSEMTNRKTIMRIFFDDSEAPHVEGPVGDFFGVMHGIDFYEINTPLLSVKQFSGYNCYFEMPFSKNARIEFENGPEGNYIYIQVDWHRYPNQIMKEKRRFCAQWRREMPTPKYGEDYLMLDADGPGDLIGFVYGVRLIDNTDRWSHGGSANIFIDGQGEQPAYIRGIGGEDDYGTSYGGALHPPESHLYAGIPYYTYEDIGEARAVQRLVGYRFFLRDRISFDESIHIRYGTMENDICSMVYWYQEGKPRRFVEMPDWEKLFPGIELRKGAMDVDLPYSGSWLIGPLIDNAYNQRMDEALKKEKYYSASDTDNWTKLNSNHGFVNFNYVHRPHTRGVGVHHVAKAVEARSWIEVEKDMMATIQIAWDDQVILKVNEERPVDLGRNLHFRKHELKVPFKSGRNVISVILSNEKGSNHGGWAFSFKATSPEGEVLIPDIDQ